MKNESFIENTNATSTARWPRKQSTFLQFAEARSRRRVIRVTFQVPRHAACATKRAMLAALRQAEMSDWMASGGDYLVHTYQPAR